MQIEYDLCVENSETLNRYYKCANVTNLCKKLNKTYKNCNENCYTCINLKLVLKYFYTLIFKCQHY